MTRSLLALAAAGAALALVSLAARAAAPPAPAPVFGDPFWKYWGDGKAELAGYDLTFPRYGQLRRGIAVTIFVTETFSNSLRVKSDPGKHPQSDEFPVMKLNLVQEFSTGIYNYNLLTNAFVALAPVNGRSSGSATKISFTSQEWCGSMYGQLLFDKASARLTSHSYFDGEADQSSVLEVPPDAISGDALLLWARGFAAPLLEPGERRDVPLVRSIQASRLGHRPVEMLSAILSRERSVARVTVPAGTFDVSRRGVEIKSGAKWTISVEAAEPHRIIEWETSDGEKASMLGSDRLQYWKLNAEGGQKELAKLGLTARAPRMP